MYDHNTKHNYQLPKRPKLTFRKIIAAAGSVASILGIIYMFSADVFRLCSFTQQSQRYVDESNFNYVEPESIRNNNKAHSFYIEFMKKAKTIYSKLQKLGINNEDARFVLPNAVESQIVVTANFREWRHIILLRGSANAQWEIRLVSIEILKKLKSYAPSVFHDLEIDETKNIVIIKE